MSEILNQQDTNPTPPPESPIKTTKSKQPLAITGLILGIIGILLSQAKDVNALSYLLGLIGAILGGIAIYATKSDKTHKGRGLAIAAVVVSVFAILATQGYYQSHENKSKSPVSTQSTSKPADKHDSKETENNEEKKPEAKPADKKTDGEGDLDVSKGKYHIKLLSGVKSVNDYSGKPTIAITYELTNDTSDDSNAFDLVFKAFQNGKELSNAIYTSAKPEGYDSSTSLKSLKPGVTDTQVRGYILQDDSPVTFEVRKTIDFSSNKQKISKVFTLAQ